MNYDKVCDDEFYKIKYKKVFKMLSTVQKSSQNTEKNTVCRTCLKSGTRDSFFRIQDYRFDGNVPIKISKMLDVIVPELALSLIQFPFICLKCAKQVSTSYSFRRQCLETETIIDIYMKNMKCKSDNLDLLEVSQFAKDDKCRLANNILSEWEDDSTEKNIPLQPLEPTVPKYQLKTVRSYSKSTCDGKPHKIKTRLTYGNSRTILNKNESYRNKLQTSWNSTLPGGVEYAIISENLKEKPVFCKETGLFKNHNGKYITLDGELMKEKEIEAAKSTGSDENRLTICEETGLFKNIYNDYFDGNGEPVNNNDVEAEKMTATVRGHHLFQIGEVFSVNDENMQNTNEKVNKSNNEIILIDDDPKIEKPEENVRGKTMLRIKDLSSMKSQSLSDKTNVGKSNRSIKMIINGEEKYPEQNTNNVPVENQSLPLTKVQIQSTCSGDRANQEPPSEKSPLPSETQSKSITKKRLKVKLKRCIVPSCDNTSLNSSKIFIHLPQKQNATWFTAVGRPYIPKVSAGYYCCEDHFDMETDCANWRAYQLIRSNIKMKQNVIPHKYIKNKSDIPKHVSQFKSSARNLKTANINAFLEKVQMNLDANKSNSCSIADQPTLEQPSTPDVQIGPASSDESVALPENPLVITSDIIARCTEEVTVKKEIQDMEFEGGRLEFNYIPIDDASSASETMVQENIQGLIDNLDTVDSYVDVPEFVQINNFTFKDLEVLKEKGFTSSSDRSNLTSFLQALPPSPRRVCDMSPKDMSLKDMSLKDMLNTVPDDTASTRAEMLEKLICNQIERCRPGREERTSVDEEMGSIPEKEISHGARPFRKKERFGGDTPKKLQSNPPRPWRIEEVPESPPKIVKSQPIRRFKIVPVLEKINKHHVYDAKYPDREICILFTNYSDDGLYINDHDYLKTPYKRNRILLEENGEHFCLCFICGSKHNITEHVGHMRTHESNCLLCDMNLGTSYMLNLHMKSHAIACNYCLELVAHSKLKEHADVCRFQVQKYSTSFHDNGSRKTSSNSLLSKSESTPVRLSDGMKGSEEKVQLVRTNTPRKRLVKRRKTTDSMIHEDITDKRVLRSALKKTESSELPST